MTLCLSRVDSARTIYNDANYNETLIQELRLQRENSQSFRVLDLASGSYIEIKLSAVVGTLAPFRKISLADISICHLIAYLHETKFKDSDVAVNQIRLIGMGRLYHYNDTTLLSDMHFSTFHLAINKNVPHMSITIPSVLHSQDNGVTYIETASKKLARMKRRWEMKKASSNRVSKRALLMCKLKNFFFYNSKYAAIVYDDL
ncbi:uncharacterized protein PRCAT00003134001 [Priceomyces carsonii]|uniref:uncharacterized protein n=1 Tax=Priceomyces carsonii TaxID=28549 RepID=UPI002ED7D66F|nr:unnamed protein product [Priceomyces carsonii]